MRPARTNPSREKLSQKSFSSISSHHETMGQTQNSKGPNLTLDRPRRASQSCQLGSICAPLAREGEIRRGRAHPRGGGHAKEQAFLHARELVRRQTRAGLPARFLAAQDSSQARLDGEALSQLCRSPPRASPRDEASEGIVPGDRLCRGLVWPSIAAAVPVSVSVTRSTATGNNGRRGSAGGGREGGKVDDATADEMPSILSSF